MRQFLKYLLTVATLVMAPLIAMEIYVEGMPNPAKDKHAWMLKHSREVETLILGSSHTFYGINPHRLGTKAYNLAQVSQTYRYDYALLTHYPMPNLKCVVLPYSYFSLWEDFETQDCGLNDANRYCIYMDVGEHSRLSKYGLEMFSIHSLWEKTKSLWQPAQLTWNTLGFGTNYTLESRAADWDNGAERAAANTYTDTTVVAINRHYLDLMARFCQHQNARLIVITTPTSDSFRASQDARQVDINKRTLREFLSRHPEAHYMDLEADRRFTTEDFYDADHLNGDGARKLTELSLSEK